MSNGLRVVTVPATSPMTSVWLWLDVGSADEKPGQHGAAHFLEHALFKGTARRGIGVGSAEIESCGGDLNAYTTWDHTVLHAGARAARWETALDVLADMACHPLLPADELAREREVVLDEIRSYDEDVGAVVNDTLRAALWGEHPYGRPVLGFPNTVSGLEREHVHAFWRDNWTADRAVLVVAGPVDEASVVAAADRLLGTWRPGPGRAPIPPPGEPGTSQAIQLSRGFETAEVQVGWRAPAVDHPDLEAISLAAAVIGQGSASALAVELQLGEGLVGDGWASYSASLAAGSFTIGFTPSEASTSNALEGAMDIVDRLRRGGVPGSWLRRARDAMLAQTWFDHETVDGRAADAAWFTARYGHPEAAIDRTARLAATQPDDVYEAAARWLDPERAVVVASDPDLEPRALPKAWRTARAPRPRPRQDGAPLVRTLDNGLRIVVLPDPGRVAALRLVTLGGGLQVPPRAAGLQAAWSDLVQAGCGPWDAIEYRQRVDALAASIGTSASWSTWSMWGSVPASELEDGVELVGEMLLDPHFEAEEWERIQTELIDEVRTLPDRPDEVASIELDRLLWRGHPWALPWGGTASSLGRIRPATIRRWHKRHLDPTRMVVAVAGGVDPAWTVDVLEQWLGDLGPTGELPARTPPNPAKRGVHVRHAGQAQATVLTAVPTPPWNHPDRRALQLAAAVLDGASGRLFMELRERRSLGYDVWAELRVGLDGGVLSAGLSCAPDRTDEALDALRAELARIQVEGPTRAELDRCRDLIAGDLANGLQRASGRAAHLAYATLFDRPWRPEALAAQLAAITPTDVRDALARLDLRDPIALVVRPR